MYKMNIAQYRKIKNTLGLSTKSSIHNASQISEQREVPQQGERIKPVSTWARGAQRLGRVGVVVAGGVRGARISDACQSGDKSTCELVRYQQVGGFALTAGGGAVGGYMGAKMATLAVGTVALVFGVTLGAPVIAVVALTGAAVGAYAGGSQL